LYFIKRLNVQCLLLLGGSFIKDVSLHILQKIKQTVTYSYKFIFIITVDQEEQQSLDESLVLPLNSSGILECFLSSDEEEYNSSFSAEHAVEEYQDWLDQQPKDTIKMISVMAMDTFIRWYPGKCCKRSHIIYWAQLQ